jgi:hypothetical protein
VCPDDKEACTYESCDKLQGCVQVNAPPGTPCTDHDACTDKDVCGGGKCVPGSKVDVVQDSDPCTVEYCDPDIGKTFKNAPDDTACDDGNVCTVLDACKAGKCVAGKAKDCDDKKPCTDDTCDPKDGCKWLADDSNEVSDGDACNGTESCKQGQLVPGSAPNCDDKNPCTKDTCDAKAGCLHAADDKADPSDGKACNGKESCVNGLIVAGTPLVCDDKNDCTKDVCDDTAGCKALPDDGIGCSDGNKCTSPDACKGGKCVAGNAVACKDDGKVCTSDACDPEEGCAYPKLDGTACVDNDACTTGDKCKDGVCQGTPIAPCDDKNPCTDDKCDKLLGCTYANNSAQCDDGQKCTLGDPCQGGKCVAGVPVDCGGGDPCKAASCDPATGKCASKAVPGAPCSPADKCLTTGTCGSDGVCKPGPAVVCDDKNPCTADTCDPKSGCGYTPDDKLNYTDDDACTEGDKCAGGKPQPGLQKNCDDANQCTDDSCDAKLGCQHAFTKIGSACSDNQPCTVGDGCNAGTCVGKETLLSINHGGKDSDNWNNAIASPSGEGIIAVGSYGTGPTSNLTWIAELGPTGAIAWEKKVNVGELFPNPGDGNSGATDVAATKDHLFVVGLSGHDGGAGFVLKLDSKGELQSQKLLGGGGEDALRRVILLKNGDIAAVGTKTAPGAKPQKDIWLVVLDQALTVKLDVTFGSDFLLNGGDDEHDEGAAIAQFANGDLLLAGNSYRNGFGPDGRLLRVDLAGKLVWQQTDPGTKLPVAVWGGPGDEFFTDVRTLPDGGALALGSTSSRGNGSDDVWLVRVDGNGKRVWERTTGTAAFERGRRLLTGEANGKLVAAWFTSWEQQPDGGKRARVTRVDPSGKVVWQSPVVGTALGTELVGLVQVKAGVLAAVGRTEKPSNGGNDGLLLRMSEFGHLTCGAAGSCVAHSVAGCADDNLCTVDTCDPKADVKDACKHVADPCESGNVCLAAGAQCDPAKGCEYKPKPEGTACAFGKPWKCNDLAQCAPAGMTFLPMDKKGWVGCYPPLDGKCNAMNWGGQADVKAKVIDNFSNPIKGFFIDLAESGQVPNWDSANQACANADRELMYFHQFQRAWRGPYYDRRWPWGHEVPTPDNICSFAYTNQKCGPYPGPQPNGSDVSPEGVWSLAGRWYEWVNGSWPTGKSCDRMIVSGNMVAPGKVDQDLPNPVYYLDCNVANTPGYGYRCTQQVP